MQELHKLSLCFWSLLILFGFRKLINMVELFWACLLLMVLFLFFLSSFFLEGLSTLKMQEIIRNIAKQWYKQSLELTLAHLMGGKPALALALASNTLLSRFLQSDSSKVLSKNLNYLQKIRIRLNFSETLSVSHVQE